MLKWADETRRRLNSSCELDSLARASSSSDLTSNSSSLSLVDIPHSVHTSKKLTPVLQKRRRAQRSKPRPQSLFVSPDQITLDLESGGDNLSTRTISATDLTKISRQSTSTPSTPEMVNRFRHRRSSITSLPSESTGSRDASNVKNKRASSTSSSPGDVLKITTKPELLKISTSNQDKNSHSFWKNLMNKKSWPTTKSHKKYIQKSTSLTEDESCRKSDDRAEVTPIDVEGVNISLGLANMVCSCDLPMSNNNVNRKTSLRELKRRSAIKRPKPFNKSTESSSDRRSCDRSPDSGYCDNRFSSASGLASSDDDTPPASPSISSKSTTKDLQAFLKNINESLRNMKVVEQT